MTTNAKTCERRNVYIITAVLMAVLIILILIFSKNPPKKIITKADIISSISTALNNVTDESISVPNGAELLATIVLDANSDGYFDIIQEYKLNDKYIIKPFFSDNASEITPANYDIIDDFETQECLIGTEHHVYQPLIIMKETHPDSVTYSVLSISKESKQSTPLFEEKTVDGVKKYLYNGNELSEEVYADVFNRFDFAHFHEASTILVEESFNMI